ncbi:MAG: hypothetical protein QG670_1822 [Thermoproteota archaeon]|nr:hypothetical protein [Thermoproteota archaeon]
MLIRKCSLRDKQRIFQIINEAAKAYKGAIPEDCYHDPYMPMEELLEEMNAMTFYGYEVDEELVGIMGLQSMEKVTLVRHSYVLPCHQGKGVGTKLLNHLTQQAPRKCILVGTWRDAQWAIGFYERNGFKLLPNKDELLRRYWRIPNRQIETSVVLGKEKD